MVALSRASKLELRNVDFRIADMEKLPFNNASADVVISNGVRTTHTAARNPQLTPPLVVCVAMPLQGFCLVPNKQQAFQEVWRVLRPGGRIAISCTIRRQLLNEVCVWRLAHRECGRAYFPPSSSSTILLTSLPLCLCFALSGRALASVHEHLHAAIGH